jgi:hypothetical protein
MLCESILIRGNCFFGNFISVHIRMLSSKLVAGVLSKCEGAHDQAEHDVEHGHEGDGVVILESLVQNKGNLAYVLNHIGVFPSFVSSLGEVKVSFAIFLIFAAEMS